MKRTWGKGWNGDGLPNIDLYVIELDHGLRRWLRLRERLNTPPSLHRRATQQYLQAALPSCLGFLDSTRTNPRTHPPRQFNGLIGSHATKIVVYQCKDSFTFA